MRYFRFIEKNHAGKIRNFTRTTPQRYNSLPYRSIRCSTEYRSPLEPNDINQIAKKNFSLRLRTESVFPPFLLWSECLLVVGCFFFTFILVHFGSITFYVISNVFICLFSHTFLLKQKDDRFVFADFVIIPLAAPTPNAHTNTSLWNFSLLPLLVDICDTQREFLFYTPYNFSVTVKKVKL